MYRIAKVFALLIAFPVIVPLLVFADEYRITVSRIDANRYSVQGQSVVIQTKFCYEYVYFEDAILRMHGFTGRISFLDSGGVCDVEAVLSRTDLDPGTYSVAVTHEDDNWYSVLNTNIYLETFVCYEYVYYQDAFLQVGVDGTKRWTPSVGQIV